MAVVAVGGGVGVLVVPRNLSIKFSHNCGNTVCLLDRMEVYLTLSL